MKELMKKDKEYLVFIREIKTLIQKTRIKAAISVNQELLKMYWDLGTQIVEKQKQTAWGDGFLAQMSRDLQEEFPGIKGFSLRNIKYMRQWYLFWHKSQANGQQVVAQIPWGHNLVILSKTETHDEALFYVQKTMENNWSRSVLTHQIEGDLFKREGKAITHYHLTTSLIDQESALR